MGPLTCTMGPLTCTMGPLTCTMGPLTCTMEPLTCTMGPLTCNMGPLTSNMGPLTCNMGPLTCNMGPLTCNMGPLTCNMGPLTCNVGPTDQMHCNAAVCGSLPDMALQWVDSNTPCNRGNFFRKESPRVCSPKPVVVFSLAQLRIGAEDRGLAQDRDSALASSTPSPDQRPHVWVQWPHAWEGGSGHGGVCASGSPQLQPQSSG
eukprot:363514-Chlamydomonas_euryale.AAC.7